jgi:Type VI secretion system effector, Hcp
MSIPALDLSVPLLSVQRGRSASPGGVGGTGTAKPEASTAGEATVTFKVDDLDPRLWTAAADGRTFDTVTITFASMTLTLHGVAISSVQTSRDVVSVTLNFSSREFKPSAGGG